MFFFSATQPRIKRLNGAYMFVLCSIKVLSDPKLSHIYISKALYKVFIHLHTHTHTYATFDIGVYCLCYRHC